MATGRRTLDRKEGSEANEARQVSEFLYSGQELSAMDLAGNYHQWIFDIFRPYVGAQVIEVGAGMGTFSRTILASGVVERLIALEPAENLYPILSDRLREHPRAVVMRAYLEDLQMQGAADSLVAVNVMEHIEDDGLFLHRAHRALLPAGTLLLFVPALPWLYGTLDREFGHHRRYLKSDLAHRMDEAGFRIELLRYMNFTGILPWFMAGRVFQRKTIAPSQVRFYDRVVVPVIRRIENAVKAPLGQSLIAIGRRS
jgi:2-polyprenyl-3-methyl-5-hydroxy-6-metoxy-1,4-benzoquinol methylase